MTSLLKVVNPSEAEGKVAELYAQMTEMFGSVPNAMRLHSISPALLERQMSYIGYFMQNSERSQLFYTFLRLLVSEDKGCEYCVNLNSGILLNEGMTLEEIKAIQASPSTAPLEDDERALLLYVLKVTDNPKSSTADDITKLRDAGFSDKAIFEAVHYGANMVMVDILFESFQLEND